MDNPERRQQLIRQVRKNGAMSLLLGFQLFVYSSQIAAHRLGLFVQQMKSRVMCRPVSNTQCALPEAMTCSVSFYSRSALLTWGGGLKVDLVKRLLSYKGKMCKGGFSHTMRVVSQLHKFLRPTCVATLEGHSGPVSCVAFHPSGNFLATGSKDSTVKFWEMLSGNFALVCNLYGKYSCMHVISCVEFDHTGEFMLTGSEDHNVKLWKPSPDNSLATCTDTLLGSRSSTTSQLGGIPYRRRIQKLVIPEIQAMREAAGHGGAVTSAAFHGTKQLFVTGSSDKTVRLWQRLRKGEAGICVTTLNGHTDAVHSVAFHPTALLLASASEDRTVKLWRMSSENLSATCVATLNGHSGAVSSVAFHPTAPLLATSSGDGTAKLWRLSPDNSSATCVATLNGHSDYVSCVAFHPTAPLLATGSADGTAKLWRLSSDNSSATCVATLEGHSSCVSSVAFHPTELLLATVSDDCTAKLWR